MLHEDYDRDGLVAKKFLVVILKELGVKMNWLAQTASCKVTHSDSDFQ
jgi:hypothetical protein